MKRGFPRGALPPLVLGLNPPKHEPTLFLHLGFPPERIRADLARFAALTGKPVLLADSSSGVRLPDGTMRNDPVKYRQTLLALREVPACVGFCLCGAYLRNRIRKRGLRGPDHTPDQVAIDGFSVANREMADWVRQQISARAGCMPASVRAKMKTITPLFRAPGSRLAICHRRFGSSNRARKNAAATEVACPPVPHLAAGRKCGGMSG